MNPITIPGAPAWFDALLALSLQATILALLVWAILKAVGRWIPSSWRALLWFVVLARVVVPIAPPSVLSLQNFFVKAPPPAANAPRNAVVKTFPVARREAVDLEETATPAIEYNLNSNPVPPPTFSWGIISAAVWGIGALFFLALLIVRSAIIRVRLLRDGRAADAELLEILEACKLALRVRYPIRVTVSNRIAAPALTGLLPARLIVPTNYGQFTRDQMRHILLHELAHIRQGHLLLHWIALIARALQWFNPVIHLAVARLRQECELAADASAVNNSTSQERAAYGETILQVIKQSTASPTLLALGMADETRHLQERLQALTRPGRRHFRALGILLAAVAAVIGLSGAAVKNEPAAQSEFSSTSVTNSNIREARILIEAGRLQEAEAILKRALEENSNDRVAKYYLDLVRDQTRTVVGDYQPLQNPTAKNPFDHLTVAAADEFKQDTERDKINRKVDATRIQDFPLVEPVDLIEVLKELSAETRRRDPDHHGINFVLDQTKARIAKIDIDRFQIKIDPPIRDITIRQLCEVIARVGRPPAGGPADAALEYTIMDYGVVFSVASRTSDVSRTFRIEPNTFRQGLEGLMFSNPTSGQVRAGSRNAPLENQMRALFSAATGVDIATNNLVIGSAVPATFGQSNDGSPQRAMFFNDRTGLLFVRAPLAEMDKLETAIHALNTTPTQISLKVEVFEFPTEMAGALTNDFTNWRAITATNEVLLVTVSPANTNAAALDASKFVIGKFADPVTASHVEFPSSQFVLSDAVADAARKRLTSANDVDAMTLPNVTTLLGRQARVSIEETHSIASPSGLAQIQTGWFVDCWPEIFNGSEIQLTVQPVDCEFLGYEKPGAVAMPRFLIRAASASASVPAGSTLAMIIPATAPARVPQLADLPFLGRLFQSDRPSPRRYMIFVTPVMIDAYGKVAQSKPK
jgi:beta-lactamase regulating signal transducer with metallopeptidase domain